MGQSARKAIAYLETQRATPVSNSPVEFKLSQATLRFLKSGRHLRREVSRGL